MDRCDKTAFIDARERLATRAVFTPYDESRALVVVTDASEAGGAAFLAHPVGDGSRIDYVDIIARAWDKRAVMLRIATRKWPHMLRARFFTWSTDSKSMADAVKSPRVSPQRLVRSVKAELSEFGF